MVGKWLHNKLLWLLGTDIGVVLMSFLAMGFLGMLALNVSFLSPVANVMREFSHTDVYYQVLQESGNVDTSQVVTIVDMTDLRQRGNIATVLERIEEQQPKVVGVDIVFEGLMYDTLSDHRLRELVQRYKDNVVFSYRMEEYIDEETGYAEDIHSFFVDEGIDVTEGYTDFDRNLYGGMKRSLSLKRNCRGEERTSLVSNILARYTDGQIDLDNRHDLTVNFRPTKFKVVSSDSVAFHPELIAGRIVLFGATHENYDMHYTPLGKIAGIELLAYSIETLLQQKEVITLPGWLTAIIAFLVALLSRKLIKAYMKFAKGLKNEVMSFFLTSLYVISLLVFAWGAYLLWMTFIVFWQWRININIGWGLAAIAFLAGAKEFCDLLAKMLKKAPK
ncbi:MAG: CHASE2 domain-containing protein [Prevotella sp.]|nr:CHASE2 domain-containing protein [Prevotella sp.]